MFLFVMFVKKYLLWNFKTYFSMITKPLTVAFVLLLSCMFIRYFMPASSDLYWQVIALVLTSILYSGFLFCFFRKDIVSTFKMLKHK